MSKPLAGHPETKNPQFLEGNCGFSGFPWTTKNAFLAETGSLIPSGNPHEH
jgi:hypothetical protein